MSEYLKVEFTDEATGVAEWMRLCVDCCDDGNRLVFGTLDSEPLNDYDGQVGAGIRAGR
jgi:hypothetical protein